MLGIEARGFIFGPALAYRLNAGFVPVRKPKKLPAETVRWTYQLEYGQDTLEMHKDAIKPGQRILIVDDLLATGGTAVATAELVKIAGRRDRRTRFRGRVGLPERPRPPQGIRRPYAAALRQVTLRGSELRTSFRMSS